MDQSLLLWFFGQSAVIIGAVVVTHVATKVQIAKVEALSAGNLDRLKDLKLDHKTLAGKVDGIGRHVARMEAVHDRCPYVTGQKSN